MNYLTGFKCLGCGKEFGCEYDNYICVRCGENLDAVYDYKAIGKVFSADAISSLKKDIWRYKPFFPFDNLGSVPPLDLNMSPLYRNKILEEETGAGRVYLKDDTRMPSASFKDRASSVVMAVAREKGVETVSCASTGNAGCSWACMGAACGMDVVIFVPKTAPKAKIVQLGVYGAKVIKVDGSYDNAFDLCVEESKKYGYFNRCTGYNPFTREGKKSVSFEIWEQLEYRVPGTVLVPVGDGNILSGVWKGFRDLFAVGLIEEIPVLVAVQSEKSDAVAKTVEKVRQFAEVPEKIKIEEVAATTIADSISVSRPRDGVAAVKAIIDTEGEVVRVADCEIIEAVKFTAASSGIFAEPAGAASVAGLLKMKKEGKIKYLKSPIVCLLTGNGLKDVDAVLKNE